MTTLEITATIGGIPPPEVEVRPGRHNRDGSITQEMAPPATPDNTRISPDGTPPEWPDPRTLWEPGTTAKAVQFAHALACLAETEPDHPLITVLGDAIDIIRARRVAKFDLRMASLDVAAAPEWREIIDDHWRMRAALRHRIPRRAA